MHFKILITSLKLKSKKNTGQTERAAMVYSYAGSSPVVIFYSVLARSARFLFKCALKHKFDKNTVLFNK